MSDCNPLVSIIIPVYNGANYLKEAIESAINQTYSNIEIIVVNDGSSDDGLTEQIALQYGDKIRYFSKENGGVSSALNLGIRNMQGQYFSWLSHDDKYTPTKVEDQVLLLQQYDYSDDRMALCASWHMDENSQPYAKGIRDRFQHEQSVEWRDALENLMQRGPFNGCALLIPKAALDKCGDFHEGMRFSQDYLMWIEMFLNRMSLVYSEHVGVYNRIHATQVTQTRRDLFYKDSNELCSIILDRVVKESTKDYNFLYEYALYAAKYNNGKVVERCIVAGEQKSLLSFGQKLRIRVVLAYGRIRPWIRKVYYKVFKHIDVQ